MATEKTIYDRFPNSVPLQKVRDMIESIEGFGKSRFSLEAGDITYQSDQKSVLRMKNFLNLYQIPHYWAEDTVFFSIIGVGKALLHTQELSPGDFKQLNDEAATFYREQVPDRRDGVTLQLKDQPLNTTDDAQKILQTISGHKFTHLGNGTYKSPTLTKEQAEQLAIIFDDIFYTPYSDQKTGLRESSITPGFYRIQLPNFHRTQSSDFHDPLGDAIDAASESPAPYTAIIRSSPEMGYICQRYGQGQLAGMQQVPDNRPKGNGVELQLKQYYYRNDAQKVINEITGFGFTREKDVIFQSPALTRKHAEQLVSVFNGIFPLSNYKKATLCESTVVPGAYHVQLPKFDEKYGALYYAIESARKNPEPVTATIYRSPEEGYSFIHGREQNPTASPWQERVSTPSGRGSHAGAVQQQRSSSSSGYYYQS